eukprot:scaffold23292_cov72-Phaeocystis_antarctica.AAC.4
MLLAHSASRRIWPRRVTARSSSAPALEQPGRDGTPNRSMPGRLKLAEAAHDSTINMAGAMGRRASWQKNAPCPKRTHQVWHRGISSGTLRAASSHRPLPVHCSRGSCSPASIRPRQHRLPCSRHRTRSSRAATAEWSPAVAMRRSAVQRRGTRIYNNAAPAAGSHCPSTRPRQVRAVVATFGKHRAGKRVSRVPARYIAAGLARHPCISPPPAS